MNKRITIGMVAMVLMGASIMAVWQAQKLWAQSGSAPPETVHVIAVGGTATVQREVNGLWEPAQPAMSLPVSSKIRTSPGSSVHLAFEQDNMFELFVGYDSLVTLQTLDKEQVVALAYGRLYAEVDDLSQEMQFAIKTPSAVCGVRGTAYEVEFENEQTTHSSYDKQVSVHGINSDGTERDQMTDIKEGNGTRVRMDQDPEEPFELSWLRFDRFVFLQQTIRKQMQNYKADHPDQFKKLYGKKDDLPKPWPHLPPRSSNQQKKEEGDKGPDIAGFLIQQGLQQLMNQVGDDDHQQPSRNDDNYY